MCTVVTVSHLNGYYLNLKQISLTELQPCLQPTERWTEQRTKAKTALYLWIAAS